MSPDGGAGSRNLRGRNQKPKAGRFSRNWGMGVAAQFSDAVMAHPLVSHRTKSPESIPPLVNVANFALLMSATYN